MYFAFSLFPFVPSRKSTQSWFSRNKSASVKDHSVKFSKESTIEHSRYVLMMFNNLIKILPWGVKDAMQISIERHWTLNKCHGIVIHSAYFEIKSQLNLIESKYFGIFLHLSKRQFHSTDRPKCMFGSKQYQYMFDMETIFVYTALKLARIQLHAHKMPSGFATLRN